jgi:hypothetical protein
MYVPPPRSLAKDGQSERKKIQTLDLPYALSVSNPLIYVVLLAGEPIGSRFPFLYTWARNSAGWADFPTPQF